MTTNLLILFAYSSLGLKQVIGGRSWTRVESLLPPNDARPASPDSNGNKKICNFDRSWGRYQAVMSSVWAGYELRWEEDMSYGEIRSWGGYELIRLLVHDEEQQHEHNSVDCPLQKLFFWLKRHFKTHLLRHLISPNVMKSIWRDVSNLTSTKWFPSKAMTTLQMFHFLPKLR